MLVAASIGLGFGLPLIAVMPLTLKLVSLLTIAFLMQGGLETTIWAVKKLYQERAPAQPA